MLLVLRQSKDNGRSKVVLIGVDNNKVMTSLSDRVRSTVQPHNSSPRYGVLVLEAEGGKR